MENDAAYVEGDRRTLTQCRGLFVGILICVAICGGFILSAVGSQGNVSDIILSNTINPNTATVESLMRLPGIGGSKARSIVEYRQSGAVVFRNATDLENIKGIGPATSAKLAPYLCFDETVLAGSN